MAEIKISELSIGDWVCYREREWIVCSLYQFTEEVGLWRKDSQLCEYVADIVPIPLTADILENNGFDVVKDQEYIGAAIDWADIRKYKTTNWIVSLFNNSAYAVLRCEIEYVHQLQHALRLAGVEKEIVV